MVVTWHLVFGILGNVFSLLVFLDPVHKFWEIIRNKSAGESVAALHIFLMLNYLIAAWYGLPFVSSGDLLLLSTSNGMGAAIELVYAVIIIIFAPKNEKMKKLLLLTLVVMAFAAHVIISQLSMDGYLRKYYCGLIFILVGQITVFRQMLNILFVCPPESSVTLRTSFTYFLSATSWFIFGLLVKEVSIFLPNGFGCLCGALQLIAHCCISEADYTSKVMDDSQVKV